MSDYPEDVFADEPDGALVRWMNRPPMQVGAAALSTAVAGAFLLGAVAAFGVLALTGRFSAAPQIGGRVRRLLH